MTILIEGVQKSMAPGRLGPLRALFGLAVAQQEAFSH